MSEEQKGVISLAQHIDTRKFARKEEITEAQAWREKIIAMLQVIHSPATLEQVFWFVNRKMVE